MPDCERAAALAARLDDLIKDAARDQQDALAAAATLDARIFDLTRGILAMAALVQEMKESLTPDGIGRECVGVRVAIYVRARGDDGLRSARRQQDHLTEVVAARDSWRIVRVFTDLGTGVRDDRPGLSAALAQARVGCFDLLAVHAPDRLARDPKTLLEIVTELSESGVSVLFASHLTVEGARCPR